MIEGRGSRVRFEKDGEVETFHRPHPAKEAKRYQVRAARGFLQRIGSNHDEHDDLQGLLGSRRL